MTEDETKDSPDKDKGLELGEDKPPDMGAGETLPEGEEEKETEASIIEQAEEGKLTPELEELMKKKGYKDLSEFAKAYESSERKITELESERRLRSLTQAPERQRQPREPKTRPKITKQPYDMSEEEFDAYNKEMADAVKDELRVEYEEYEKDKQYQKDYAETMAVVNKNPERFEELKPTLVNLHRQYPDATMAEIYPVADEMEKTQRLKKKDEFLKETFGHNVDVDKLKTLISKTRPATITDAGGTGAETINKTSRQKMEDAIWAPIAKADIRRE